MDMSLSKLWEMVKERGAWHAAVLWIAALDACHLLNSNQPTRCQWHLLVFNWKKKKKVTQLCLTFCDPGILQARIL